MKVSMWIGNTPSWDILDDHLTFAFTDDGEAIPCRFCEAFGIDWFDEDFREASHSESATHRIGELLQKHSRGEQIAEVLGDKGLLKLACNAVVLLYEFEYSGSVQSANIAEETTLCFLGCVEL